MLIIIRDTFVSRAQLIKIQKLNVYLGEIWDEWPHGKLFQKNQNVLKRHVFLDRVLPWWHKLIVEAPSSTPSTKTPHQASSSPSISMTQGSSSPTKTTRSVSGLSPPLNDFISSLPSLSSRRGDVDSASAIALPFPSPWPRTHEQTIKGLKQKLKL